MFLQVKNILKTYLNRKTNNNDQGSEECYHAFYNNFSLHLLAFADKILISNNVKTCVFFLYFDI
jgi:hypothetical protein